ncbi:type VI secretion system tip protein TssI/VgrG [Trinickia sp. YCB016]
MQNDLLKAFDLQDRTVTVASEAMPRLLGLPALRFLSMNGTEKLGDLDKHYYNLELRTPDDYQVALSVSANLDLKALLGKEMTVAIELDGMGTGSLGGVGAGTREISGIVTEAAFARTENRYNVYEIQLRPWLWLATLTTDYKVFQDKTVIDIIDEVLKDYPYPVEKRLDTAKYQLQSESERNEPRAFQVQYGETDFHFIQRLMEEWGIYWFFEHSEGKHRLVLCDHIGAHRKSASEAYHALAYHPQGDRVDAEFISRFSIKESLFSGRIVIDDFDFTRPRANLASVDQQPRETSWNMGERYEWPGDYSDGRHGELSSRVKMEALRAPSVRSSGAGSVRGLACGQTFELTGYPQDEANREYLVISSTLKITEIAEESGSEKRYAFDNAFCVQPTSEVFRLPRATPKPTVSGPQSAIVVGPAGQELWTDEFGRVKVRFLWDRYGNNDEHDSCWVRVSQAWAGVNFGGIYIPRIGQEVIIGFWNGDPDRPVIIGSLYNSVTRPPWELPGNATQSGFMSRTITGGQQNYNGMRFEDKTGNEEFMMQAEKDMNRLTKHCESHTVGVNYSIGVGLNQSSTIGGALTSMVAGVAAYTVGGMCTNTIGGASITTIGGAASTAVGLGYLLEAGEAISIKCGKAAIALLKDGTIAIAGGAIKMIGSDDVTVQGKNLHLNPGDTAPPAPGAIPLPFPVALPPIPKPMVGLGVSVAGVARPKGTAAAPEPSPSASPEPPAPPPTFTEV